MPFWIQTMAVTWLVTGPLVTVPFMTFAVDRVVEVEDAASSSLMFRLMMHERRIVPAEIRRR